MNERAPHIKFDQTSATKHLALLAIPTFGQLIAEPTFVLIDTAIVGHLGNSSLAGLSLGSTVILTAVGLCIFLAYSTTSQVARLFGAGKQREGFQAGLNGLWLSLTIGVILAVILFALARPICAALGGTGETLNEATIYAQMAALGVPGMLLVYGANGIFRGLQKINITLIAAICGAVLNTVLDLVFIIGFGWGIAGSGIATGIAQWFMGIFLIVPAVYWAIKGGANWKPRLSSIAAAGGDGFPLFLRTLALRASLVATVMAAASMGTEVLAGYQVVNATWNFAVNALDSIAIAGQTLVGAEIGAKRFKQARTLTKTTGKAGFVVGIAGGLIFILAGFVAAPLFSPSPEVQILVTVGMTVVGIAMPLQGWMWALDGILIGAGDYRYLAKTCTLVSLVYICVLAITVSALVPLLPNDLFCIGTLWVLFNAVFMGGRGIANGLRARNDIWMKNNQA